MNLYRKQKKIHRQKTYGCQREGGRRDKLAVWYQQVQTTIHKIDEKQGNNIQYLVLMCNEK